MGELATFLKNGQRSKKENWATYEEASRWAQENCIKGAKQWYRLGDDRPINMPSAPEITYKDEWTNWPEFLKNGKTPNNSFVSYEEASKWAQDNNIKTGAQWFALRERPDNLPTYPSNVYKKDWSGWADFLGVEPYQSRRRNNRKTSLSAPKIKKREKFHSPKRSSLRIKL